MQVAGTVSPLRHPGGTKLLLRGGYETSDQTSFEGLWFGERNDNEARPRRTSGLGLRASACIQSKFGCIFRKQN